MNPWLHDNWNHGKSLTFKRASKWLSVSLRPFYPRPSVPRCRWLKAPCRSACGRRRGWGPGGWCPPCRPPPPSWRSRGRGGLAPSPHTSSPPSPTINQSINIIHGSIQSINQSITFMVLFHTITEIFLFVEHFWKENLLKTWHCKAQVRQIRWATFE